MTRKVQQLHKFRNLVMLESVFGWILSGSLNADGTKNHVINTNVTNVLRVFATDRYNCENDVCKFWDLETLGISEKESSCYDNYPNSFKKILMADTKWSYRLRKIIWLFTIISFYVKNVCVILLIV